ncbi:MAG TPA: glycosyltransferase family 2 protein [Candidatus Krumholzibacteria bacterium]|nr:glycosyltransferase family 2 protein [Candidatus Krumholzibacteria bacterium]
MSPFLSVVLVVRDAAPVLGDALRSLDGLADEIVVLDTGSHDDTMEIARAHPGVRLYESVFDGFGAVKQRALEHCRGEWVLSLDADERVSPELRQRIEEMRANREPWRFDGYRIRRRNWMMGRAMRTMGLQKDAPLRLFRREGASFSTDLVDETVVLPPGADVGYLDTPLEHHTLRGIDQYLRKQDHYTTLDLAQDPRPHDVGHLITVWPSTFFRDYVARGGWRDAWPGLLWAGLTATGRFMRDMKVWIAHETGRGPDDGTPPGPTSKR